MKKIFFLFSLLISLSGYSQHWNKIYSYNEYLGIQRDSVDLPPGDTLASAPIRSFAIKNNHVYQKLSTGIWSQVDGGGNGVQSLTGTQSIQYGAFAAMPAAGTIGRYYAATDSSRWYFDNGIIWLNLSGVWTLNNRTGAITLLSTDVIGALGYTPLNNLASPGQVAIGNGSGVLAPQTVTGDFGFSSSGVGTINANAVTNAKAAPMGANTIKANNTGSSTNPIDATPAQIAAMLPVFTTLSNGLVNFPGSVAGRVLSDNGTWIANGASISLTTNANPSNPGNAPTLISNVLNFDTTSYPRIFNVLKYGARGDGIDTVVTLTSGNANVVCANALFTLADVGKSFTLDSAGAAGIVQQGTITGFVNSTTVTLSVTPQITGSGHHFFYGTESTAGIQAAIDSCFNQYGSTVWIPYDKTGMYYIGGAMIDHGFFRSQLYIPFTPYPYVNRRSIKIIGESEFPSVANYFGATFPIPIRGVTLRSALTSISASSEISSVLGMSGPTGDAANPLKLLLDKVYMQDFTVQTYTNRGRSAPILTGINAFYADQISQKNVNVSIDVPLTISHKADSANVAAEIISQGNNTGINVIEGGFFGGYTYGLSVAEHSMLKGPQIFSCTYGLTFPISAYTVSGMVYIAACKHNIYFPKTPFLAYGSTGLARVNLDVECERDNATDIGTFWYNTIDMVSDSANYGRGNLRILYDRGGSGGEAPITTTGAGMLHIEGWNNPNPTYALDSTGSGITQGVFFDASTPTWRYRANVSGAASIGFFNGDTYFRSSPANTSGGGFATSPTTNMFLQGSNGQLQINHYGASTFTGTATSCAAFDASGHMIEVACGSSGGTPALDPVLAAGNTSARQLLLTGNNTTSSNLTAGNISLQSYAIANNHIGFNTFFNGTNYQYIGTGYGSQLISNNNTILFKFFPSGTGGSSASTGGLNPAIFNLDGSIGLGGNTGNTSFPYTGSYLQISSTGDTVQIPNILLRAIDTTNTKIIVGDASGNLFKTNWPTFGSGGGAVSSVSNSDGTLTISPTTGAVVGSLALGHANTWSALQTFGTLTTTGITKFTGLTSGSSTDSILTWNATTGQVNKIASVPDTLTAIYSIKQTGSQTNDTLQLVNDQSAPGANQVYSTDPSGNKGWHSAGSLFAQTANGTVLTNTTTNTNIMGTGVGSMVLGANSFYVGETIIVHGFATVSSTGTPSLSFNNNTWGNIFAWGPPTTGSSGIEITETVTILTLGSAGTAQQQFTINYPSTSSSYALSLVTTPITFNTTTSKDFSLFGQWSVASTSNIIQTIPSVTMRIQ